MLSGASLDIESREKSISIPLAEEQIKDCSESLLSLKSEETFPPDTPASVTDAKVKQERHRKLFFGVDRSVKCKGCKEVVWIDRLGNQFSNVLVPVPGDSKFDVTYCPNCKPEGSVFPVNIRFLPRNWVDIANVAINNLIMLSDRKKLLFLFRDEICEFVEYYWNQLASEKNKATSWESTMSSAMHRRQSMFSVAKMASGTSLWYFTKHKSEPILQAQLKEIASIPLKKRKRPNSRDRAPVKKSAKVKSSDTPVDTVSDNILPAAPLFLPFVYYSPNPKIPLKMILIPENSAIQVTIENQVCMNECNTLYQKYQLSENRDFLVSMQVDIEWQEDHIQ